MGKKKKRILTPEERERYAARKREAVAGGATMLIAYSAEKGPLIDELLEQARAWAAG